MKCLLDKILIFATILAICPFVGLAFYNQPFFDDFVYGRLASTLSLGDFFGSFYYQHTGRYTLVILSYFINPLKYHWLEGIKLSPLVLLCIYSLVQFYLLFVLLGIKQIKQVWYYNLILIAFFLHSMPNLNEFVYWFSGAWAYFFPMILIFLFYARLVKIQQFSFKWWDFWFLVFLSFIIVGTTELAVLFHLFLLFCLHIYYFLKEKKYFQPITYLFLGSLLLFSWVLLIPGQTVRYQGMQLGAMTNPDLWANFHWGKSLILSAYFLVSDLGNWLNNGLLVLLSILLLPVFQKIENRWQLKENTPYIYLILFGLGSLILLWIFKIILLKINLLSGRHYTQTYFIFICLWLTNIQLWVSHLNRYFEINVSVSFLHFVKFWLVIVLIFPSSGNINNAYYELVFVAPLHEEFFQARQKMIENQKKNGKQDLILPAIKPVQMAKFLFMNDINQDTTYHINRGMAKYYQVKTIRTH
ncbi:MAG: DUF6056 family protein [Microscillaceae bacterium]|jgi:hypothetical protein|nr:DUF6056 family protein [Microscillaceae bacterium]